MVTGPILKMTILNPDAGQMSVCPEQKHPEARVGLDQARWSHRTDLKDLLI